MNNTRKLVESALMSAIVGAFVIIDRYTVGFMSYFIFLLPLPMVYLSYKYDVKISSMATFACVVLTFIFGNIPTVFTVLIECIIGIIYGNGLRKKENSSTLLIKVIALAILMNFFTIILFAAFFGYDIVGEALVIQDTLSKAFMEANIQVPNLKSYVELIVLLSVFMTGIFEGYLTHISSRLLLSRLKFNISRPTPIFLHKPNKVLGYIALIASILLVATFRYNIEDTILRYAAMFIGMICYIFLVVYGCIGAIVLIRAYAPSLNVIGAFFILFAVMFMSLALLVLGFLYITTNMRETAVERIINDSQNRSTKV